jgi:hypothetical protein
MTSAWTQSRLAWAESTQVGTPRSAPSVFFEATVEGLAMAGPVLGLCFSMSGYALLYISVSSLSFIVDEGLKNQKTKKIKAGD